MNEKYITDLIEINNRLLNTVRTLTKAVVKADLDNLTIANVLIKKRIITKSELDMEAQHLLKVDKQRIIKQLDQDEQVKLQKEFQTLISKK